MSKITELNNLKMVEQTLSTEIKEIKSSLMKVLTEKMEVKAAIIKLTKELGLYAPSQSPVLCEQGLKKETSESVHLNFIVKDHLEAAKEMKMCGIKLTEMSNDELMSLVHSCITPFPPKQTK